MTARIVLLFGLLTAAPGLGQQEQEEEPFEEPTRGFEAGLLVDVRFAHTDETQSFMDGGLGKTRYGGDENGGSRSLVRVSQLSFTADARFSRSFGAYAQLNFDAEPDRGDGKERVDLVEAFLRFRFGLGERNELRGRVGLFFPPISLEHPGKAWTTVYTITPSVINGWVGEEIRSLGTEVSFARTGLENEVSFSAAGFGWNDPNASLLAFRGWGSHDRQTGLADRVPLAPLPSLEVGGAGPGGRRSPRLLRRRGLGQLSARPRQRDLLRHARPARCLRRRAIRLGREVLRLRVTPQLRRPRERSRAPRAVSRG